MHQQIFLMSGHPGAWQAVQRMKVQLDRLRRLSLPEPATLNELLAEHRLIVDALEQGLVERGARSHPQPCPPRADACADAAPEVPAVLHRLSSGVHSAHSAHRRTTGAQRFRRVDPRVVAYPWRSRCTRHLAQPSRRRRPRPRRIRLAAAAVAALTVAGGAVADGRTRASRATSTSDPTYRPSCRPLPTRL